MDRPKDEGHPTTSFLTKGHVEVDIPGGEHVMAYALCGRLCVLRGGRVHRRGAAPRVVGLRRKPPCIQLVLELLQVVEHPVGILTYASNSQRHLGEPGAAVAQRGGLVGDGLDRPGRMRGDPLRRSGPRTADRDDSPQVALQGADWLESRGSHLKERSGSRIKP